MRIDVSQRSDVFRVRLIDSLTFSDNTQFRGLIEDIKLAKVKDCIFDLAELKMIDSSGLGMLMIAIEEGKKHNFTLSLINTSGPVKQLLQLSRLDKILKVA